MKSGVLMFLLLMAVVSFANALVSEGVALTDGTIIDGVEVSTATIPRGTLSILGLTLNKSSFDDVRLVLGAAGNLPKSYDPHARDTVCYSITNSQKNYLSFSTGWSENPTKKLTSFTLASGNTRYRKNDCAPSSKVTRKLTTTNGLRLGITQSQTSSILGKPGKVTPDWVVYSFHGYGGEVEEEYTYNSIVAHFTAGKLDLLEVALDW